MEFLHGLRIERLPERHVAVVEHRGPAESVDATRRPLYQHMIIHELVGGPSILRFLDPPQGDRHVDALVTTHPGFEGDAVCRMEVLPAGPYVVGEFEGPVVHLAAARKAILAWARDAGHHELGPVLQVHLMDPIDGVTEQQLQVRLAGA